MGAGVLVLETRVFGLPIAQGRPRAFKTPAGQVRVYDPANARDWKRTVQAQVISQKPAAPVDGPLAVALRFYLPRPQSLPRRELFPAKRPDAENLAKAVLDAMEGVVYRDDAQIVRLNVSKDYGPAPGVLILVERVAGPAPPQGELIASHDAEGR
jgi:Holliday junction resolvase RusA-like endonuclease